MMCVYIGSDIALLCSLGAHDYSVTSNPHPILETLLVSMAFLRLSLFEVDVSSGESTCSILLVRSSCDSVRGMEGDEEPDSGTVSRGPGRL